MKNNYYNIKKRNSINKKRVKKQLHRNPPVHRISKLSSEEKRQSNYRKRKAKKLNYKKVFIALLILLFLIYLIIFGFSKLIKKIKKPKQAKTQSVSVQAPQDITINMAVVRRYNVSFIKY